MWNHERMSWLGRSEHGLRKIAVSIILALIFVTNNANATLGPVRVELNLTKPKMSHARANSVNAFKINFRYNVDIKYTDWYKIWFPIDEAVDYEKPEQLITEICDGLPDIKNLKNNPRFVPNDLYFKKYGQETEKNYGRVYTGIDNKGTMNFKDTFETSSVVDWGNVCPENKGSRIIKDPSGFGCWMMGTVFPKMPLRIEERYEVYKRIMRSIGIMFGMSECEGWVIIKNDCNERSYQDTPGFNLDAWRKGYNSIDWNSTIRTGIIAPATPGRYRVAVATKPEPEPVESEAFVLPCSKISIPTATVNVLENPNSLLQVSFSTGEGGALDGGTSQITMRFPPAIKLPNELPKGSVLANGKTPAGYSMRVISKNNCQTLSFTTNVDVENMGRVTIDFLPSSRISIKDSTKPVQIEVCTTSEPEFVKSEPFTPKFESVSIATGCHENEVLDLTIRAALDKPIKSGDLITIAMPTGFIIPKKIEANAINVDGKYCKGTVIVENTGLTFKSSVTTNVLAIINISNKCIIINPPAGKYVIKIKTGEVVYDCGQIEIVKRTEK